MDKVISILVTLLDGIFFLGLLGSVVVLVLTSIEDMEVLLERDQPQHATHQPPPPFSDAFLPRS